jgi:hypothetical protein
MTVSGKDPEAFRERFSLCAVHCVTSSAHLSRCGNIDHEYSSAFGFAMMLGFYVVKMTGSPFIVAIVFR